MECIICLKDISNNDFIVLECCKQNIHIDCLKQWINTNYNKNTDISLCIYCKNKNNIINDMINNIIINVTRDISNSTESTESAEITEFIITPINIPIHTNTCKKRSALLCTVFNVFFLCLVFIIILL